MIREDIIDYWMDRAETHLPVTVADDPLTTVVLSAAKVLDNHPSLLKQIALSASAVSKTIGGEGSQFNKREQRGKEGCCSIIQ